jgi:hypothetical protein
VSWRSSSLTWLRLAWPREVEAEQISAVFRLLASSVGAPVVLQAVGTTTGVEHSLAVTGNRAAFVTEQLRTALPGLGVTEVDPPDPQPEWNRAIKLGLSTRRRPLRIDHPQDITQALLSALNNVAHDEQLVLQWVLGPVLPPIVVTSRMPGQHSESWTKALIVAPWSGPSSPDSEARTAQRAKQGEPGWRAIGRIAVAAATLPRQRQLLSQVLGALRSAQAGGVSIRARDERPQRVTAMTLPWFWPVVLNVHEVVALSAWPIGATSHLPVAHLASRPLPPSRSIARRGRIIGRATWSGSERSLALSPEDSLRHLHVIGPTGVGKSTLLLNLIVQDMTAGRAVVVIEPKGDLIADVLQRVPPRRINDVVVLDPTDNERPVGINPLAAGGRSPELVADQLLAVFHGLYAAHWGPRTQDILHASLLTLARSPGMTLVGLPLLLSDPQFRRGLVGKLNDPLALGPFWAGFEAWSEAERATAISPVMNKLRPFILRPQLRAVIGQAAPNFDVRQVFTRRKILLVNLSKGQLGPEAAALLGSLVVGQLWQATLERSAIEPRRRHPVMVFIDEFQDYLHLPTDLSEALAEARGLGVGLSLAHQHLHQLEPAMRSAVLANARSRVCFQLAVEDARTLAASSQLLEPEDFQSLGRFEAYAALVADGAVQPWCSLLTNPPTPETSNPAAVRASSRDHYGIPRAQIEAELEQLVVGRRAPNTDDLSPRRRGNGDRP